MSDMQFRAVRKRADKSESEKATVSECSCSIEAARKIVRLESQYRHPRSHKANCLSLTDLNSVCYKADAIWGVRSKLKRPLFVAHDMSGFKS
jgi:hypothetical protein